MGMIKTQQELRALRDSGKILVEGVRTVLATVQPGMHTNELNTLFERTIRAAGATPSFLGYKGYPKAICTSVNNEVVHAIPSTRVLQEGDIIGIDCGVRYKGMCTDMSRTVSVGVITSEAQRLIDVTCQALTIGVAQLIPGHTIGDVGAVIQEYVEAAGYSVVRVLVGHGIGAGVHEEPHVPNYGTRGTGARIQAGMALAIEPMVNIGSPEVAFDKDGWTVRTVDGTLSAHFEDTVIVTSAGPEVITPL